jgi:hypothetical protein
MKIGDEYVGLKNICTDVQLTLFCLSIGHFIADSLNLDISKKHPKNAQKIYSIRSTGIAYHHVTALL